MRCSNCNCELDEDTLFCPSCGTKVGAANDADRKMQEEFEYEERKACVEMEREKEGAEEWNKKRKAALETEKKLQFKLDNLKAITEAGYPGIKKYYPKAVTGNYVKDADKNKTNWLIVTILAAVAVIAVFLSWFSIPFLARYLEIDSSTNLTGSIGLLNDAMKLLNGSWGLGDAASELNGVLGLLMVICIAALVIPVFYVIFIWKYFQKESESELAKWAGRSSLYGMIVSGIVVFGTYIGNAVLGSESGLGSYGIDFIKPETGAWLMLLVSIAVYVLKSGALSGKSETVREYNTDVEVTNFEPALLFRPVKLHLSMYYALGIKMEIVDFEHPYVYSVTADIHLYRSSGEQIVLPQVKLTYISDGSYLYGTIDHYQVDFNGITEAKVFVKEYQVDKEIFRGSGMYVDCDYSADMLRQIRSRGENMVFKDAQEYGEYRICSCGHMYKKELTECPLCGKER